MSKKDSELKIIEDEDSPVIYITDDAWKKLMFFVDEVNGEISGVGVVECEDGNITINDILIYKQESSAASTLLDGHALCDLLEDFTRQGKDTGTLRVWWHSHANMGPSFSTTDFNTMEENFSTHCDWMISLCINKHGKYSCILNMYKPLRVDISADLRKKGTSLPQEIKERLSAEVKEKVKAPTIRFGGLANVLEGYGYGGQLGMSGLDFMGGVDSYVRCAQNFQHSERKHPFTTKFTGEKEEIEKVVIETSGVEIGEMDDSSEKDDVSEYYRHCTHCGVSSWYKVKSGQATVKCKVCCRPICQ